MLETHGQYQSYLLRLYRPAPGIAWRVILESIPSGEQQGFANLQEAFLFLETQSPTPSAPSTLGGVPPLAPATNLTAPEGQEGIIEK